MPQLNAKHLYSKCIYSACTRTYYFAEVFGIQNTLNRSNKIKTIIAISLYPVRRIPDKNTYRLNIAPVTTRGGSLACQILQWRQSLGSDGVCPERHPSNVIEYSMKYDLINIPKCENGPWRLTSNHWKRCTEVS
jgi:hypothetical protein